jgi:hypothetical protein
MPYITLINGQQKDNEAHSKSSEKPLQLKGRAIYC